MSTQSTTTDPDFTAPPTAEPIVTAGWVGALVAGVITLGTAFGLPLTDEQAAAILGLVAIVAPLAVALIGRRSVVEYADRSGAVRSGARSELTSGAYVRQIGDLGTGDGCEGCGETTAG